MLTACANELLDAVIENNHLKNDAALSRFLGVEAPVISKLRHGKLTVGATLIIKIHEVSGIPVAQIKAMAGLPAYGGA